MADRTMQAALHEAIAHSELTIDDMAALLMLDQGQDISALNVPPVIIDRLKRFGVLEYVGLHEIKIDGDETQIAARYALSEYGRKKCAQLRDAGYFESILMPD